MVPPLWFQNGCGYPQDLFFRLRIDPFAVLAELEPGDDRRQRNFLRRIVDEQLAVLLELGMEGHAQKAFLVLRVLVAHLVFEIEEQLGLLDALVVREDVDLAEFRGDEHAVRAITGVRQHDRPHEIEIREGPRSGDRQRAFVELNGRIVGQRDRRERAGRHVGHEQLLAVGAQADIGRGLEGVGQQRGRVAFLVEHRNLARRPLAHVDFAVLVARQAVAAEKAGHIALQLAVVEINAAQLAGDEVKHQHVAGVVDQQSVRPLDGLGLRTISDQRRLAVGRDAEDGPMAPFQVARVRNVEYALSVDRHVVQEQRLRGKRVGRGEDRGLAVGVDFQDLLFVGDEQDVFPAGQPLGVVEPLGDGLGLAVDDFDDRAVAVLIEFTNHRYKIRPSLLTATDSGFFNPLTSNFGSDAAAERGAKASPPNNNMPRERIAAARREMVMLQVANMQTPENRVLLMTPLMRASYCASRRGRCQEVHPFEGQASPIAAANKFDDGVAVARRRDRRSPSFHSINEMPVSQETPSIIDRELRGGPGLHVSLVLIYRADRSLSSAATSSDGGRPQAFLGIELLKAGLVRSSGRMATNSRRFHGV